MANLHLGAPQLILLGILLLNLLTAARKDGQPKGAYNLGHSIMDCAIVVALLWWGGFLHD